MNANLLTPNKDPMGYAIADYFSKGKAGRLRVFSSQFEEDEIPVDQLFRTFDEMPVLEQKALELAQGKILDCGAGSGCHALALQDMGKDVEAIDISPRSVEVMQKRGIQHAYCVNLFDDNFLHRYDTILMLMNGTGIIGNLDNIHTFFARVKQLLKPGGCLLIDSSDLRYLFEEEDGSIMIDLADDYYGQVDFQMQYKEDLGDTFDWLYLDFNTLAYYAEENGFKAEVIAEGEYYDYLAKLTVS